MNSACAKVLLRKTLGTPDSRRCKIFDFAGTLSDFSCSAEMNSACAKVLLRKTLVTPDSRRIPTKSSILREPFLISLARRN